MSEFVNGMIIGGIMGVFAFLTSMWIANVEMVWREE